MKKILLSNVLVALVVLAFAVPWHSRAQIASTSVTVGFDSTLTADAGKFLAVPMCSIAAGCNAQLQLCNTTPSGDADSGHCIFIAANGQNPWATYLWVGVSETTPSGAGTSTTPYGFGTMRTSVPNNELNIVP